MVAAIFVVFGLILGSFLNVCISRMPRDLSVVRPRSRCPVCGHPIRWLENVPLLSWLLLGRQCRYCQTSISWRYPAVEAVTAALFWAAALLWGASWPALKSSAFFFLLICLIVSDLETRLLPDEFTLGGLLAGLAAATATPSDESLIRLLWPQLHPRLVSLAEAAVASVLAGGVLWLVGEAYHRIRRREGLGFGDVKMVAMIGAFLGLQRTLLVVLLGCLAGTLLGVLYVVIARKDFSTYQLPFGSFLGAAAVVVTLLIP